MRAWYEQRGITPGTPAPERPPRRLADSLLPEIDASPTDWEFGVTIAYLGRLVPTLSPEDRDECWTYIANLCQEHVQRQRRGR